MDLFVANTWMDWNREDELAVHEKKLKRDTGCADTDGFHHDERTGSSESASSRLRLVQDRPQTSLLRFVDERTNAIHRKTRCKFTWIRLEDSSLISFDELDRLDGNCAQTPGCGFGKQGTRDERMDDDGAGAQDTHFDMKKGRTLHVETGQEHATQSHLERAACIEKRETRLTKIARHAEAGKAPKPAAAHFNWTSSPKDQDPNKVLTDFFQKLYSIQHDQAVFAQKERTHWMELWRNLRADCAAGPLISTRKLERVLSKLKNERALQTTTLQTYCRNCPGTA